MNTLKTLVTCLIIFSFNQSIAKVTLIGAVNMSNESSDVESAFILDTDLRLGYSWSLIQKYFLGVQGVIERHIYSSANRDLERSAHGIGVSLKKSNLYGLAAYLFNIEEEEGLEGDGFKFDIGYGWRLNKRTIIGPRLSFKTFDLESGQTKNSGSRFLPMFSAYTEF